MLREQTVMLTITYDPGTEDEPRSWNWADLLDCDPEWVHVNGRTKTREVPDEREDEERADVRDR